MVDEIINHLYKIGKLKVISRTSSMRYKNTDLSLKEIAQELGVATILEGSVRKVENEVRITAQLIDAKTDTHLWSETFAGDLTDVFSIQAKVAQKVAAGLEAILSPRETDLITIGKMTKSTLAYDLYLKGNDIWNSKYDAEAALVMYSKAIEVDSLFTQAYARRGFMHLLHGWLKIEGWMGHDSLALLDLNKGKQLDPESIEVKFTEAVSYYMLQHDYDKSLELLSALKKDAPNMADLYAFSSYNFRRQGKLKESIDELGLAISFDPLNTNYLANLTGTYDILHEYDSMIETARNGLSLIPDYNQFKKAIFYGYLKKTGDLKLALLKSGIDDDQYGYEIYYYARDFSNLISYLQNEFELITTQQNYITREYLLARTNYLQGIAPKDNQWADRATDFLEKKMQEIPQDSRIYATLGICYAFKGMKDSAITRGEKACAFVPYSLDAYLAPIRKQDLMEILIITGEFDRALDIMEQLLGTPSWLSRGILKVDPIYDQLRDLPRFQELMNDTL